MRSDSVTPCLRTSEIVEVNPFHSRFEATWAEVCLETNRLYRQCLDSFLACFVSTTRDMKRPLYRIFRVSIALPFWMICTLITIPIGLISFLLWLPVSKNRRPYRYSYIRNAPTTLSEVPAKDQYACATANVCIMPEFLTRINNQQESSKKPSRIGRCLTRQQVDLEHQNRMPIHQKLIELRDEKLADIGAPPHSNNTGIDMARVKVNHSAFNGNMKQRGTKPWSLNGSSPSQDSTTPQFIHDVCPEFPQVDFLLLQEVWYLHSARALARELHRVYPYIVYDARVDGLKSNGFMMSSGLMIASRAPIVDIRFNYFRDSVSQCRLASKGLLQVKVSLGTTSDGRSIVGFLANTHLQAYQGIFPVQTKQMDDIVKWTEEFRCTMHGANEIVAFDIIGGDFNSDNMSPVDRLNWDHQLFRIYTDLGRARPGLDHPWTIGTEMRHTPLDDPLIQTPLGLKMAVTNPYLLQHYVLNADIEAAILEIATEMPKRDKKHRLLLSPVGGRRRIDCVLYRQRENLVPVSFNAITQLAGLTDHIPYCLTFKVQL